MGTENTIFYRLKKWGICKNLVRNEYSVPDANYEGIHAEQYYGCNKNNQPYRDVCNLEECPFKDGIKDLAETFNKALKAAKKEGKK